MKKFLKIISAILAVCVTASLFGCNTTKEEPAGGGSGSGNGGGSQTVDPNPPSSSGKEPASPDKDPEDVNDRDKPVVAPTGKEGAISAYNDLVASLANKKFSYDADSHVYSISENLIRISGDSSVARYFEKSGNDQYRYRFNADENCYYREEYDLTTHTNYFSQFDDMLTSLQGVVWASFEGGVLSGTNGAKSVTYEVANSRNVVTVGAQRMEFHGIGASITLPPWKEKEPEPPAEEKLYDAQGNLNYPLFAETIKDWMNDGYYTNKIMNSVQSVIYDIDQISIDEQNNKICFGAYTAVIATGTPMKTYQNFSMGSSIIDKIMNRELNKPEEMKDYLDGLSGKSIALDNTSGYELSSYDASNEDCNKLNTIAQNILDRLATVGYQGNSINNVGTKVTDYVDATVLSVRKEKDVDQGAGLDMGDIYSCAYFIQVKRVNKNLEIITFNLAYSTNGGSNNILSNTNQKSWIIRNYSSKEIDYTPYAN